MIKYCFSTTYLGWAVHLLCTFNDDNVVQLKATTLMYVIRVYIELILTAPIHISFKEKNRATQWIRVSAALLRYCPIDNLKIKLIFLFICTNIL